MQNWCRLARGFIIEIPPTRRDEDRSREVCNFSLSTAIELCVSVNDPNIVKNEIISLCFAIRKFMYRVA